MKVLLIDNYDSFTFNIVELLRKLNVSAFHIVKNDKITSKEAALYDKIILSPGPSLPKESGNIVDIIQTLSPSHSILGICLGHQAIAEAFGALLINEPIPFHGFQTALRLNAHHSIFNNITNRASKPHDKLLVGLYHSWTVSETNFPNCLEITSFSKENKIMSIKHKEFDIHGVQFHPESYMTQHGKEILANFLFH